MHNASTNNSSTTQEIQEIMLAYDLWFEETHTQIQLSEVLKTNIKINIILIRWPSIEDLMLFVFSLTTARGTTPLWNLIVLQFSLLRLGTGSTYNVDDQSCDKRDAYVDSDLYKIFWIYFY